METKLSYVLRVKADPDMKELFQDPKQRVKLANQTFRAKWAEATVTVRRADGTEFFID